MKVIFLNNQARAMFLFWKVLIGEFQKYGHEIICACPAGDTESDAELKALGVRLSYYNLDRKGLNPARDIATFLQLKKLFTREKPDLLFASTIKPVIYGCLAAKSSGIPRIYAAITGLGYVFEADTSLKKLINLIGTRLYKFSLRNISGIFFQNKDDKELFAKLGLIDGVPAHMERGTGVNLEHFHPVPFPDDKGIKFLLVARLLEAKGLREYAQAAEILHAKWPNASFQLLGPPESGPGAIGMKELRSWQEKGLIDYAGETRDVRPYIANAHVAVLPSWREGVPTSLMEAMAMGRPLVSVNSPGCREVIWEARNGFLAEPKNPASLARCMEKFLEKPELIRSMGEESRKLACEYFDARKVAEDMYSFMLQS